MKKQEAQIVGADAGEASRDDPHFCATEGCQGLAAMTYLGRPICRGCWEAQCGEQETDEVSETTGDACRPTEEQEPQEQENAMSKKKSTKSKATKKPAKSAAKSRPAPKAKAQPKSTPKATKTKDKAPKRVSALDAAAQVLKAAGGAMRAQDLITAMAEQGLWTSPGGKTPHSTLYAAMQREERAKGKDSRFKWVERGKFEFNG